MRTVPYLLILSRLLIGFVLIWFSLIQISNYSYIAITLLIVGLLTDVFDGIIARRLNVSTRLLRRMDSSVDQVFFICIGAATYIQCPSFFLENWELIALLFAIEILTYVVSFAKFKKEVATHSIGAKAWTLLLVATIIQIMYQCDSFVLFLLCIWIGVLTRLEIIAIILMLKEWTNDVPSIYHAYQLRMGREIKRNKWFNG